MGQVIRDDIQFLRGLSVILIFLFHLNQNVFQYFYVGVDIFFIISGFVITSSIFNHIKFKNDFYFFCDQGSPPCTGLRIHAIPQQIYP